LRVAGYDLSVAVLSRFRLDGGAMFGAVPKALWDRYQEADARNRIGLVARVLVLRRDATCAIVDAGLGEKFGPQEIERFAVAPVPEAELPFRWEELTDVVLTHLHFDHAGGVSVWEKPSAREGASRIARLRAPQARVVLGQENWDLAQAPGPRERASYLPENVQPLATGRLDLVCGAGEVLPGVRVHPSRGHTRGMQWVTVGEGRGTVAFPADLVPTASHLHLPFAMGYDMCVEVLLREKEAFLRQAVEEEWTVVFAHDESIAAARVVEEAGRFALGEIVEI